MKNKLLFSVSFFLILSSLLLIFYLHNGHKREIEHFLYAEKNIHQLFRLSESIDADVLRLLNFRINNFDSLSEKIQQLRKAQNKLYVNDPYSAINLPISGIKKQIDNYLAASEIKQQLLEHIKSNFASYKITLHYIPTIAAELNKSMDIDIREHINALYALLFNYNLLPANQVKQQLQQKIDYLQSLMLEHESVLLLENLLFHVNANLAFQETIQSMFDSYNNQKADSHLIKLDETIEILLDAKTADSYKANNIFLVSIIFLLSGLLFAIHYFRVEKSKASDSRDMFLDAIESIDEAFSIYDNNDKLISWNSKFEQLYPRLTDFIKPGISYQQLVEEGIKREQFDYQDYSENDVRQLMLVSHNESLKNIMECINGGRCYLANSNRTSSGGIASVHIDITERKKMEAHLLELSRAVEQSPAAVVITNTKGNITYVNPKFEQITGYGATEVLGENPRILKSGHTSKEDYQQMWESIHSGKEWSGIFHNKRKNGELFWEQAIMSAIRNNNNKIIAYLAIKEDITRRRFHEEQLRMASMVFETSSEAIIVSDKKNRIKLVNPSFEKITGYKADEVMGKNPSILSSNEQGDKFYKNMWEILHRKGRWQGEIWNRRKNGEIYPEWLSISLLKDEQDNISEYVAVFSDISERKKSEEKIQWQANFDHLTQLPNRNLFIDRLKQFISTYKREQKSFALLFLDLDRFKVVNDTLGHSAGDLLLQEVAKRLQQNLSESDTIARFGGDEFTVLLPRIKSAQGAAYVADRLISELKKPFVIKGADVFIGSSIGITIYPDDAVNETSLIRNADMAMYHAKENGRNCYHFYTESMNEEMLSRIQLEKDLRRAIDKNEPFLEFQPVICSNTEKVVGAEALVRWAHPEHGRLGPDKFIAIAEDTGLIKQLGEWVLNQALTELSQWHSAGYATLYVAVNVSSAQRLLGFTSTLVQQNLEQHKLEGKFLTLEITESLLMDHTEESLIWLQSLKETGLKLSIDDFGTGFSSLSYLHRFPMDVLKVDKSFVDDILHVQKNAKLVDSIISLAHNFDLSVVAEGVEEKAQLEFLRQLGSDYIQGYYYSKPLAGKDFLIFTQNKGGNK